MTFMKSYLLNSWEVLQELGHVGHYGLAVRTIKGYVWGDMFVFTTPLLLTQIYLLLQELSNPIW